MHVDYILRAIHIQLQYTGCFDTLFPPPQTNSGVVQTIQLHCSKLEPFSAIDFKGFCFLSIFTIFS